MDRPAAESVSARLRAIAVLLAPFPGRSVVTLRMTLICTLVALVTAMYSTPEAALSVYIVFFLIRPDRVLGAILPIIMMLLVVLLLLLILAVTKLTINHTGLRLAAMALLSIAFLYLGSASKLRPLAPIIAMIVGFGLDEMGRLPVGEGDTRILLYAALVVAIPVGLTVLVTLIIAPAPRLLACAALARRLDLAAAYLREPESIPPAYDAAMQAGNKGVLSWLKLSILEGGTTAGEAAALRQACVNSIAILSAVKLVCSESAAQLPATLREELAEILRRMAAILALGGYPLDVEVDCEPAQSLAPAARGALQDLQTAMRDFAVTPAPTAQPAKSAESGGFFLPDATHNPQHAAYALKTTGAAMFCYVAYHLLDWPGIHTCFITCYIVSLGTAAETVHKLNLRIVGCLIGAFFGTLAIVFVMPHLDSVGSLLVLVALASAVSSWIAMGSERIAYVGFQMAFAFFLCVIQGAAPAFDLTILRDRTLGILLGNVVVYLVFTRIAPVSMSQRVEAALSALRAQWFAIANAGGKRYALAAQAFADAEQARDDLAVLNREPSWLRPDAQWRARYMNEISALSHAAPAMLVAAGRPEGARVLQARLVRESSAARALMDPPLAALMLIVDKTLMRADPAHASQEEHHAANRAPI